MPAPGCWSKCLKEVPGVNPVFVAGGWPADESVFDGAKSVVFFMDGGGGHPIIQGEHLDKIKKLMDKGVGLVCMHYAVEIPKDKGGPEFLDWLGGYYETGFSTNPHWTAEIKSLPDHPITRGVKPFSINDEWYYNMRFRPEKKGVTPILVAKAERRHPPGEELLPRGPTSTSSTPRGVTRSWPGPSNDPTAAVVLVSPEAISTRTGPTPTSATLVLNAIVWSARLDVPQPGSRAKVTSRGDDPEPRP